MISLLTKDCLRSDTFNEKRQSCYTVPVSHSYIPFFMDYNGRLLTVKAVFETDYISRELLI